MPLGTVQPGMRELHMHVLARVREIRMVDKRIEHGRLGRKDFVNIHLTVLRPPLAGRPREDHTADISVGVEHALGPEFDPSVGERRLVLHAARNHTGIFRIHVTRQVQNTLLYRERLGFQHADIGMAVLFVVNRPVTLIDARSLELLAEEQFPVVIKIRIL